MINRILMELYDDYEKGNIDSLKEFTKRHYQVMVLISCLLAVS